MNKNDPQGITPWDIIVAGALLTRLPLPKAPKSAFETQAKSVWAFPLIGVLVAALSSLAGMGVIAFGGSNMIAAGIMLGVAMITTGAMHEDGLADCADGFWGGFDPARRLEIMKDSQIGTYGVLALIVVIGLRWLALSTVIASGFLGVFAAAALSRGIMPMMMAMIPHARDHGLSHHVGRPAQTAAVVAFCIASGISFLCLGFGAIPAILITILVAFVMARLAKVKIIGQTGDVLGATQVLAETAILIYLIA